MMKVHIIKKWSKMNLTDISAGHKETLTCHRTIKQQRRGLPGVPILIFLCNIFKGNLYKLIIHMKVR